MLYTNLKHIESAAEYAKIVNENENVMIICGRMGDSNQRPGNNHFGTRICNNS